MTFRAGDTVKHHPTGETWVLATDEERGEVCWAGWPPGYAKASDCTLVEAATEKERLEMLERVAAMRPNERGIDDHRKIIAIRQYAALTGCSLGKR